MNGHGQEQSTKGNTRGSRWVYNAGLDSMILWAVFITVVSLPLDANENDKRKGWAAFFSVVSLPHDYNSN